MFGLPRYSVFKDLEKAREEAIRMRLEHEDSQVFHQHMAEFYKKREEMINEALDKREAPDSLASNLYPVAKGLSHG